MKNRKQRAHCVQILAADRPVSAAALPAAIAEANTVVGISTK
jgi:hypothetical protein